MEQFDGVTKAMKSRLEGLGKMLWGCSHKRTSFPITISTQEGRMTYVVCTQCGRRFAYDWATMSKNDQPF
jgi:hypothetical protein